MNHVNTIDLWKAYGEERGRGIPAHEFILTRTQPVHLPTATAVLVEKEWMRIKRNFSKDTQVPFFRSFTDDGVAVHVESFRYAAVFNHNPLRPKNIELLYESHTFAQFGELLLPLTSDGTLVFAKKINQLSQFSGFGGHIDMERHHQKRFDLRTAMQEILVNELGPLAHLVNMRVVGSAFIDQDIKRGADIDLVAESKFSESDWLAQFPQTEQFSRELIFVEPTAAALIAAVTERHAKGDSFSPSAIAACYFIIRSFQSDKEAEVFRDAMNSQGHPIGWDNKPSYLKND